MNYKLIIKPLPINPKPKAATLFYDYARELKALGKLVRKV